MPDVTEPDVRVHEFRDGFLPYVGGEVKGVFEGLKDVAPDLVLTHTRHDLHQDHRLACELTWNTFAITSSSSTRSPSTTGTSDRRTCSSRSEEAVERKLRLVREHYASQHEKHWFDDELFRGLMRLRGMESASRYAEAFTCRKLRLLVA